MSCSRTHALCSMQAPRTTRALTRALTCAFLAGRQVDVGARRQVGPTDCGELLVRYVQPGMLLPQIRKLKLAPALLKVVAAAVQYKRNALEGQKDKTLGGVPTMGDEISIELFKAMQVRPPTAGANQPPPPPPASPRGLCIAAAAPQRAGPAAQIIPTQIVRNEEDDHTRRGGGCGGGSGCDEQR